MEETPKPASSQDAPPQEKLRASSLFVSVFIIATCGLIYELVAGTLASYLLGDSVTQFSTIIGSYMFAMGIGSYLSKYVQRGLAHRFVDVELSVALVGGLSAPVLFLAFAFAHEHFGLVLYGSVLVVGTLVGLEIPLLLRLLKHEFTFKDLVAQVLTFDYVGALAASLLFP
ncbi:MAG: polyamine aminopropyltransferase, partial [Myxococcota bacterium]